MSATRDRHSLYYADTDECEDVVCETCGTMLTQLFAEVHHQDSQGAYAKFRGHCPKCNDEKWSEKLR
jgi:hypothetical protein